MFTSKSAALNFLLPIFAVALVNRTDLNSTCFDPITATWCASAAGTVVVGAIIGQMEGDGLRCCCDSDVSPESDTLCRFITKKKNGKCPRADLGRGWSQTHSAQRDHGVLNPDKCILTGDEVIDPLPASSERMQCGAREEMDAKIFPPEKTGNWAIRMAFAHLPAIGKLFLGIEDLQVSEIDMTIKLKRKSDDTFSFEIVGPDGKGDAIVKAQIQGIHFQLPESQADGVVKAIANMENIGANIVTLGMAGKNYGKVDNSPADVNLQMKGDVRVNEAGEWEIVPGSELQEASVNIGNGGALMGMVNLIIKHLGGMDQIFFDVIWPLVKQLFPATLGIAFQKVPLSQGEIEHTLKVSGRCINSDGKNCPDHVLTVDIKDSTFVRVRPRDIIDSLLHQGFFKEREFIEALATNTMKAYNEGRHVFDGMAIRANLGLTMNPTHGLVVTGTPTLELPYNLLSQVIGPSVEFGNFIGSTGEVKAAGSCKLEHGVLSLKDLGFQDLALPVGSDASERIEVTATIDNLEIEVEESGDDPIDSDLIFGKDSPLFVRAPGIDIGLGLAEGLTVKPLFNLEGTALKVAVAPAYLDEVLKNATKSMLMPASVRTASQEKADGVVPPQFTRPHAFMKEPLDLTSLMKNLNINTDLVIDTKDSNDWDLIDVKLDLAVTGDLSLTGNLWRGMLNNKDKDSGYLHVLLPGYYGEFDKKGEFSGTPAVASLNCASLWLYQVDPHMSEEKAFEKVIAALDVGDADTQKVLAEQKSTDETSCIQVRMESAFLGMGTVRKYFCTKDYSAFQSLRSALSLQQTRMDDAADRWPNSCHPGPNGNPPTCLGNPDGTWFAQFNPLDASTWFPARVPPKSRDEVKSPRDQWIAAVHKLRAWRA